MVRFTVAALLLLLLPGLLRADTARGQTGDDMAIASKLAELLRATRIVVSQHQDLINDPARGDKGLAGERVLAESVVIYRAQTGENPISNDASPREKRLLQAQMAAIEEVGEENQEMGRASCRERVWQKVENQGV